MKKNLIVVVGSTAVGKTNVSIHIAKKMDCEILSADSRQFYREMKIGTAKPDLAEMQGITHHFIDYKPIEEEISAGRFEVAALEVLDNLFVRHDCAVMTGGSGLYVQAVCKGMNDIPIVPPKFRKQLYHDYSQHGLDFLQKELFELDPEYYQTVDLKNPQRIIRALEVCRTTSKPYSSFRADKPVERNFNIVMVGLERPREELFERIDARMDKMIAEGLFEEAIGLYEFRHFNALKTVGYKEIFDYLDGLYDKEEAIRLLKRNSRRYAKRQMTWFKSDDHTQWFHPDDLDDILNHILTEIE